MGTLFSVNVNYSKERSTKNMHVSPADTHSRVVMARGRGWRWVKVAGGAQWGHLY